MRTASIIITAFITAVSAWGSSGVPDENRTLSVIDNTEIYRVLSAIDAETTHYLKSKAQTKTEVPIRFEIVSLGTVFASPERVRASQLSTPVKQIAFQEDGFDDSDV